MTEMTEERAQKLARQLKLIVLLLVVAPALVLGILMEFRFKSLEEDLNLYEPSMRDEARMDIDTLPWHPVMGQTLYVPAYSHIYHQDNKPRLLTVTLSIRNTDRENEIVVSSVKYYDTSGNEKRSMLKSPLKLGPLASTEFVIEQSDKSGGSGASFIVHWQSGRPVTHPVVETVMIDTSNDQGISFVRPATVLDENSQAGPKGQ
ncbi:hypothetical protein K227x_57980 [Rubripirellula lacrimiformis]|uniref:DUF3124 domain-containing protein n=1 Tax=Rubripirellula lacrimiformis TaxID=1930273 RepID=A0A517NJR5_9BACT|nr:DUF3124 domain-containing protein [Rubripirellula lacrimiformis]QDT07371.1 hypothetical protein K227x_57980 [Rubripirellula lacrimiformis]